MDKRKQDYLQGKIVYAPQLIDLLGQVKDKRNRSLTRHQFIHNLLITILSIMSGYEGYRVIASFVERFEEELISSLQI